MNLSWLTNINFICILLSGTSHAMESLDRKSPSSAAKKSQFPVDYMIRKAALTDKEAIKHLYQKVASTPGGLARTKEEITDDYINKTLSHGVHHGLFLVVESEGKIIGTMVKYKLEPKVFAHILGEGSILVHPDFQGMGIGSTLITAFLKIIENQRPDILRVELIARESNPAIKLYEKLGFKREGRFEDRIIGISEKLEADIPMAWFNPKFNWTQKWK